MSEKQQENFLPVNEDEEEVLINLAQHLNQKIQEELLVALISYNTKLIKFGAYQCARMTPKQ